MHSSYLIMMKSTTRSFSSSLGPLHSATAWLKSHEVHPNCWEWDSRLAASVKCDLKINKNGVLWSQTRMRIEMRLKCFFWSISNWQLAIWIRQWAIWQNGVSGYLEVSGEFSNQDLKIWIPYYCVWKVVVVVVETRDLSLTIVCVTSFLGRDLMLNN